MKSLDYCSQEMVAPSEQQLSEWNSLVADPKEIENRQAELYDQLLGQRTADGKIQLQLTKNLATTHLLVEDPSTGRIRSFALEGASFACVKCRGGSEKQRRHVRVVIDADGVNPSKRAVEHVATCHGESKANIVLKQLSRRLRFWTEQAERQSHTSLVDVRLDPTPLDFTLATFEERLEPIFRELVRLYDTNLPPMTGNGVEEIWKLVKDPSVAHIIVRDGDDRIVAGLSFSTNDHYAEIHFTAVDEQRRRKGIGRDCVQELVLILKTPQYHVPTIVVQSDEEARGFYKRVSFTSPSYEEREALYNDGLQRFMGTLLVRKCERLADKAKKGSDFRGGKRRRMVADDEGDNDRCV